MDDAIDPLAEERIQAGISQLRHLCLHPLDGRTEECVCIHPRSLVVIVDLVEAHLDQDLFGLLLGDMHQGILPELGDRSLQVDRATVCYEEGLEPVLETNRFLPSHVRIRFLLSLIARWLLLVTREWVDWRASPSVVRFELDGLSVVFVHAATWHLVCEDDIVN